MNQDIQYVELHCLIFCPPIFPHYFLQVNKMTVAVRRMWKRRRTEDSCRKRRKIIRTKNASVIKWWFYLQVILTWIHSSKITKQLDYYHWNKEVFVWFKITQFAFSKSLHCSLKEFCFHVIIFYIISSTHIVWSLIKDEKKRKLKWKHFCWIFIFISSMDY